MNARITYDSADTLPAVLPVFPLAGVLLLPRGQLPLNIFEPRYLDLVDYALGTNRLIGMVQPIQPSDGTNGEGPGNVPVHSIGCIGRISLFEENDDNRYFIMLTGIARFEILNETKTSTSFRQMKVSAKRFDEDFLPESNAKTVDRSRLLLTLRNYSEANDLEVDWGSVNDSGTEELVNSFSMASPYGAKEKQALLEAESLSARADTLIALAELEMAVKKGDRHLQ